MTEKEQIGVALVEVLRWPKGVPSILALKNQLKDSNFEFSDEVLNYALALNAQMAEAPPTTLLHVGMGLLLTPAFRFRLFLYLVISLLIIGGIVGIPKVVISHEISKMPKILKTLKSEWSEQQNAYAALSWAVVGDVPLWIQPKIDAMHNGEFSEALRAGKGKLDTANTLLDKWVPVQEKVRPDTISEAKQDISVVTELLNGASKDRQEALNALAEADKLLALSNGISANLVLLETAPSRLKDSAEEERLHILKALDSNNDFSKSVTRIAGLAKTAELVKNFKQQISELEAAITKASVRPTPNLSTATNLARTAFDDGEYTRALELLSVLQDMYKTLSVTYRLSPVQVGGKDFIFDSHSRPTHIFVKALSWDGTPIRVRIIDEKTGAMTETDTWAEPLSPVFASILQATLLEGGGIHSLRFGEKEAGYFEPKYFFGPKALGSLQPERGRLTTWE